MRELCIPSTGAPGKWGKATWFFQQRPHFQSCETGAVSRPPVVSGTPLLLWCLSQPRLKVALNAIPFLLTFCSFTPPGIKQKYISICFLNLTFSLSRVGRYRQKVIAVSPVLADISIFGPAAAHGSTKSEEGCNFLESFHATFGLNNPNYRVFIVYV